MQLSFWDYINMELGWLCVNSLVNMYSDLSVGAVIILAIKKKSHQFYSLVLFMQTQLAMLLIGEDVSEK